MQYFNQESLDNPAENDIKLPTKEDDSSDSNDTPLSELLRHKPSSSDVDEPKEPKSTSEQPDAFESDSNDDKCLESIKREIQGLSGLKENTSNENSSEVPEEKLPETLPSESVEETVPDEPDIKSDETKPVAVEAPIEIKEEEIEPPNVQVPLEEAAENKSLEIENEPVAEDGTNEIEDVKNDGVHEDVTQDIGALTGQYMMSIYTIL